MFSKSCVASSDKARGRQLTSNRIYNLLSATRNIKKMCHKKFNNSIFWGLIKYDKFINIGNNIICQKII